MNDLFLLLGSNLGDRSSNISNAIKLIANEIAEIDLSSGLYETDPWGNSGQDKFLNQVIKLQSNKDPVDLLENVLSIEQRLGRTRDGERNSARTIDIDILFYGDMIVKSSNLEIPHPRIHLRKFVLVPMNEIAPGLIHPVFGKSIDRLLRCCPDKLEVRSYSPALT